MEPLQKIGFGGGCHWCTEAVFQSLRGVTKVTQGWIASEDENTTFSEAVLVDFFPTQIPVHALIEIHLRTHSSTSEHAMRKRYRSAIYTFSELQQARALQVLKDLEPSFNAPVVTQVLPFVEFRPSQESFREYYFKNPEKPFCKSFIDPKLRMLRQHFSRYAEMGKLANLEKQ